MNTNSKIWLRKSERQRFVQSVSKHCKTGQDFYIDYILPLFIEEIAENFETEPMSGAYFLPTTEDTLTLYATPYWETDEEVIPCSLVDDTGHSHGEISIPFPKSELTGNPREDAERYLEVVSEGASKLLDCTLLLNPPLHHGRRI